MKERNIGIVGDGATDRLIFGKIVECMLSKSGSNSVSVKIIELDEHDLHNDVDLYWKAADRGNVSDLASPHALQLRDTVIRLLTGAFSDFVEKVEPGSLTCHDILLITTDTEKPLRTPEAYFEPWAFSFSKILIGAIEQFYAIMAQGGYYPQYLPIILSVATFPSTEILVGAVRNLHERCYGKKPKELKRLLYDTEDISRLKTDELRQKALDPITPESIVSIFRHVPELRIFIQTVLALAKPIDEGGD
jgi:hypothetical protein